MKDECAGVNCHKEYYLTYLTIPLCRRHWNKFCNFKEKEWTKKWRLKLKKLVGVSFYKKIKDIRDENKKIQEYLEMTTKKKNKKKKTSKTTKHGNTKSVDFKRIKGK